MGPSSDLAQRALDEVHRDPAGAIRLADAVLADDATAPQAQARAHWARGLGLRERDDLEGSAHELDIARRLAAGLGDDVLAANINVSRSLALLYDGSTAAALDLLEHAEPLLGGADLGRLWMQRGLIEERRGNLDDALGWNERALPLLVAADDAVATARLLANLGVLYVYRGDAPAAIEHCRRAAVEADRTGQHLLSAGAVHNLGYALGRAGRTVEALDALYDARTRYRELPPSPMQTALDGDLAEVYLDAGLVDDALIEARRCVESTRQTGNVTSLADALLRFARSALVTDHRDDCADAAAEARELFVAHGRPAWAPVADALLLRSETAADPERATERAAAIAHDLLRRGWRDDAADCYLLAARLAGSAGLDDAARRALRRAKNLLHSPSALQRFSYLVALADVAVSRRSPAAARRAIARAFRVLGDNQRVLGAVELRAAATAHARQLRDLGLGLAIEAGRPWEFHRVVESAQGLVDLIPRSSVADDQATVDALDELRSLGAELSSGPTADDAFDARSRRRSLLEQRIRSNAHTRRGGDAPGSTIGHGAPTDVAVLQFGTVGDDVWSVSIVAGRAAFRRAAGLASLREVIEQLVVSVTRLQRQRLSAASAEAARAALAEASARLSALLIPDDIVAWAGPLVICPTASLHGVLWSAIDTGRSGRSVTVASSLAAWHRSDRPTDDAAPNDEMADTTVGEMVAVVGPDLPFAETEASSVAAAYPVAHCLRGEAASVEATLARFETASIGHLACHGTFRSDNPMFSSMLLHDGEMTIFDLERCGRLPRVLVVSACDAAQNAATRGGALLGLASTLVHLGVSSVIAPLTPVNDERSVGLMVRLHRHLADGMTPAAALAAVRADERGQLDATAAPFICFGR